MTEREALKLALEALEMVKANADDWQERTGKEIKGWMQPVNNSITAIKEALAQPNEKEAALLRALEIIAVGDAKNPQAQAAEELIAFGYWRDMPEAITLAQPEQEPVGFTIQAEIDYAKNNPKEYAGFWANKDDDDEDWIALYTNPPQRKPLTREVIERDFHGRVDFVRQVEAAHGIKGDA